MASCSGRDDVTINAKPKKPLSAYNLFFRFERARILRASELNCIDFVKSKEGTLRILPNKKSKIDFPDISTFPIDVIRDQIKNESSRRSKRSNKRAHGKLSFTDMIQYMCRAWNNLDPKTRETFNTLAAEEKGKYTKQLMAYNKARYDSVKDIIKVDGAYREPDNVQSNSMVLVSQDTTEKNRNFLPNDSTRYLKDSRNYAFLVENMIELEKFFCQRQINFQSPLSLGKKTGHSLKYQVQNIQMNMHQNKRIDEEEDLALFLSEFDWHSF